VPTERRRDALAAAAPAVTTALVALATVFLCVRAYRHYTTWLPPLQADEAGHALPAARMALDLRQGALGAFLDDTQRETMWPFVHPWALAAGFLLFGISTETARAASLVFFAAAIFAAFLLARELARPKGADADAEAAPDGAWIGTVAAVLMVASADFWVHSSVVMIEPLGMLVTLACLLAHARATRRPSPGRFLVVGLLAAATLLTKYNYGFPLVGALMLSTALGREPARPGRRALGSLAAGLVVPVAAWLAYPFPDKLRALYGFSVNRDEGLSGLADFFFYPASTAEMIGWPLAVLLLVGLAASLARARDERTSCAALFALLGLAMITAHPNKQLRYVFTVLPVLYVLGELELRRLARRSLPPMVRPFLWPVLLVVLAVTLDPRPVLRAERQNAQALRGAADIMDFVVARVRPDERILVLGSGGRLPHLLLQWELVTRYAAKNAVVDLLPFPGDTGWDPRYRQGYPAEMTPEYDRVLAAALRDPGYDRIVTLAISKNSPFSPDWLWRWDAWGQNYVVAMERQRLYAVTADQAFPESGVRVRVYARR
jgi:hypothetical protein